MMDDTNSQIVGLLTEIRDLLKNQPTASSNGEAPANRYMNDKGVWGWEVPSNQKPSSCRYCQQDIFWVKSKKGKNIPCDSDGVCHYETCPEKKHTPKPMNNEEEKVPF